MALRDERIQFGEEIDRLEREREDLADEVAALDADDPSRDRKISRGNDIDAYLDGLEWAQTAHEDEAVPAWDESVDAVTLGGLTGGEYGRLEQDLSDAAQQSDQGIQGAQRVYQVRAGTVTAPYLDPSADEIGQLTAVASLPVGFLQWAQHRIDELSSVGNGDRESFADLVAARSSASDDQ